mmetsp:Transcript_2916/g.6822  ORF Transcript_2916/g.6822 Transcript_2916/m.6822 type:complete len:194 (+) Transcript_2916:1-582(+)
MPILFGGSIYCLFNYKYKGWYSWLISCAANGVYAFGFVLMTPQIFINYKLRSVAHLPWRALMYKAFNTFVDDAFAWIIEMPTAHRLATLRDDLVFFVYLYQRWLYPVDKTRPNEYGFAYEKKSEEEPKGRLEAPESQENSVPSEKTPKDGASVGKDVTDIKEMVPDGPACKEMIPDVSEKDFGLRKRKKKKSS